jgi:CheY-like chemotaxis protein/Tfp pilus assembly protein PilZ
MAVLGKKSSFLNRADIRLFTAATSEDVLATHQTEKVNLIIAPVDMPGMNSERLYALIRDDRELRTVSVILVCPDEPAAIERATRCKANTAVTLPIDVPKLLEKAQQLLDISWRESYRVLLSVRVEGNTKDTSFFCSSENISTTGILIETDKALKQGDHVLCSFFLPDAKQIKTGGQIIRVIKQAPGAKTARYGVIFNQLTPEARSAIEDFVEKKSRISTSKR